MNTLRGKQVARTSFILYTSIMGYLLRLLKFYVIFQKVSVGTKVENIDQQVSFS